MKTATISEFKAHISANLREVRAGESFVIMDRHTAVAEVGPVQAQARREIKARTAFCVPDRPNIQIKVDAQDLLAKERGTM